MTEKFLLEMEHISKSFPGVKALDDVQLKVRHGSVHALMGENGAGKSTLMKVLIGIHKADEGDIVFKGNKLEALKIKDTIDVGISMIHQELSPIPHMTIAENIFLGREPVRKGSGLIDEKKLSEMTENLFQTLDINLNPKTKMKDLTVAKMQLVEIAKAISYNAELIIMDEPTSAITEQEVQHLFRMIRSLVEKGVSIIYISHKMDEIFDIADEITVFRDGRYIESNYAKDLTHDKLISLMIGRELSNSYPKEEAKITDTVLEVRNFTLHGKYKDISFKLRKGEILGFIGLVGAGRTEVMEAIYGISQPDSGDVFVAGEKVGINHPKDAIRRKIVMLTEDRKLSGLFLPHTVKDNMTIANISSYIKNGLLDNKKIEEVSQEMTNQLSIKTPNLNQTVNNLSGGNQQKVLIAKWLLTDPDILILDEPTRGIDVGAKWEIYKLMSNLAMQGKSIIMISSEMPEVIGMSDRILVMHEGQITGELLRGEANQDLIMRYASGLEA